MTFASTTPAANKVPKADGTGKIDDGWLPAEVALGGDLTLFGDTPAKTISAGEELYECLSTGLTHWTQPCVAPVSAGASLDITIYAWSGHAVYNTDISDANWTYTAASQTTGTYTLPGTPTDEVYWVYWDISAGAYAHQTTEPTAAERITDIYLARVIVRGGFVITAVADANYVIAPSARFESYARNLGLVNIGVVFSGNASLSLSRSAGSLIDITGGLYNDVDDPDRVPIASANPVTFQHITQTAATGTNVTVISPGNYDVAGTITAIGGSNLQAQVMRIYLFPSGNVRVAYGQVLYNKLSDAVLAHATESYTENPDIDGNGKLIAFLCVTKGCTDLTDSSTAVFIQAPIIGTGIGAGAASVTTRQRAYDNSGDDPTVTTSATGGPAAYKEGTGTASTKVLTVLDNADTEVASINGEGNLVLAGTIAVDDTTDATSTTTGSLQTDGGLGVAKAAHIGTTLTVGGTINSGGAYQFDVAAANVTHSSATNGYLQLDGGTAASAGANIRLNGPTAGTANTGQARVSGTTIYDWTSSLMTVNVPLTLSGTNALTVGGAINAADIAQSILLPDTRYIARSGGHSMLRGNGTNTELNAASGGTVKTTVAGVTYWNVGASVATLSVPLRLNNAAVAATPTPTHTITIQDSTGTTYRIPCVV